MRSKSTFFWMTALLLGGALVWNGCLRDQCDSTRTFVRFDPVYKTGAEIRVAPTVEAPRPLRKPGKMYAIGTYLLINERQEGIHVIDNSNPQNPQNVAFWNIPGNVDMAVRDGYLYADQYVDLLSLDISDLQNPQLVCRLQNQFALHGFDPTRGFLVDYTQTTITEEIPCSDSRFNQPWWRNGDVIMFDAGALENTGAPGSGGLPAGTGIAGSYARFGQYQQYLYTVDNFSLKTFTVSNPACPARLDSVWLGWNIETIFPWKDRLFVGAQNGVYILNNTNPQRPVLENTFRHATGCDPVVCDDNYAYVTLHDGTTCNGTINQLDIIDIRYLPTTSLTITYPMKRPKGLSVFGNYLYLCDDGLKIFDKSNPLDLKLQSHIKGIETYDAIALDSDHLLVVGDSGFLQFDVSDPKNPKQISEIRVDQ